MTVLFVAIAVALFFPVFLSTREMIRELYTMHKEAKGK